MNSPSTFGTKVRASAFWLAGLGLVASIWFGEWRHAVALALLMGYLLLFEIARENTR